MTLYEPLPFDKNSKIRILVMQYRPIGDVLLSTPLIKILKKEYPNSYLAFLSGKLASQVLINNPHLDKILIFPKSDKDIIGGFLYFLKLRKYKFDLTVDLLGSPSTAWASLFSGAKYRIGYDLRGRRYAYNLKTSNITEDRYSSLKKLVLLKRIGIYTEIEKPEIFLTDEEVEKAEKLLSGLKVTKKDFTISISPVSKRQARRWTKMGYAELCDILISEYGAKVVFHWGPGELEYVNEISGLMKNKPVILPPTSVREMASIISLSDLMITNCNGHKHIAVALNIPTITVFGPTNPKVWNPSDLNRHPFVQSETECIGCDKQECEHKRCMEDVKAEKILEKVKELKTNGIIK
ncbi:glycosyltransferase family 9 protein [candidate division KSB1 bacterium]